VLGFLGAAVAIALLIVPCVARLVEVVVVPHVDEGVEVLSIRQHARQRSIVSRRENIKRLTFERRKKENLSNAA
jgi:hypothetical protein